MRCTATLGPVSPERRAAAPNLRRSLRLLLRKPPVPAPLQPVGDCLDLAALAFRAPQAQRHIRDRQVVAVERIVKSAESARGSLQNQNRAAPVGTGSRDFNSCYSHPRGTER